MGTGFRTAISGGVAAPPYTNGPYTFSEVITFEDDVTVEGDFTVNGSMVFGDAAVDTLTIGGTATVSADNKFYFRDTGLYVYSSADGQLDIVADTTLAFSGNVTMDAKLDVGTYSSMTAAASGSTTELVSIGLTHDEDDFIIGLGCYVRATGEDTKPFGVTCTMESTHTTGIDRMQAGQFISLLGTAGGSEAAHLKTLGGDATAGMYGVWAKVGANTNCVCDSGSRVAAVWVDNQMSGTVSGEEYGIFATTGASKPDAFIGFETTSSGWANFLSFDETSYDQDPVASATISGGTQDLYLKVNVNGTAYGIPLYTGW